MSAITSIRQAVQGYLDDRRRLGFAMAAPATELMRFARYADARGHCGPLTQELILGWAREHVHRTSTVTAARRLEIVRHLPRITGSSSRPRRSRPRAFLAVLTGA